MGEVVIHALLCADKVIVENNGKKGIIGVFDRFNLPNLPVPSPPWFIFAQIANVKGKHQVVFNLVNEETSEVTFSVSAEVEIPADREVMDLHILVGGFPFTRYGKYVLSMHVDGPVVHSRSIMVVDPTRGKENA